MAKKEVDLEKVTQKAIINYLLNKGVLLLRINSVVARIGERFIRSVTRCGDETDKGVSDLLGCTVYGNFIAVEVKRKGEYPTEEQKDFLKKVTDHGGIAILAYTLEEAITGYEEAERNRKATQGKK